MLLQTNSYIVPKDKRAEHARLLRRFRQVLTRIGCDSFEVYEQVGSNWNTAEITGRVVQIMRFRDRRHQLAVQAAERSDPAAQAVIAEFCELINFPYQQQQGLFAVGFYNAVLPMGPRGQEAQDAQEAHDASDTQDSTDAPAGGHEPGVPPHTTHHAAAAAPAGVMAAGVMAAGVVAAGQAAADEAAAPVVEPPAIPNAPIVPETTESTDELLTTPAPAHGPFADGGAERIAADQVGPDTIGTDTIGTDTIGTDTIGTDTIGDDEVGAEGILDAAEHLSDEQLDAGGDAAVAEAIAGPTRIDAGPLAIDEDAQADDAGRAPDGEQARAEELDLGSLLDAHLDRHEPEHPGHAAGGNGKAHADWADSLSLEGALDEASDEERMAGMPGRADAELAPETEHGRNHVSQ